MTPSKFLITLSGLFLFATGCGPGDVSDLDDGTEDALSASCTNVVKLASASASTEQSGNPAAHAIDGSTSTRWSGNGKGAYLTVKLAAAANVCGVQVAWFEGTLRKNSFVVSVSADGKTFENVVSQVSSGTTNSLQGYALSAARSAQYVRVTVNGNTLNDWAAISEVKVLASTATTETLNGRVKPGPSNTGIPAGTKLTKLVGDQVINAAWMKAHPTGLPAGAGVGVMQNQDIYGRLHVTVPGFTLKRSRVRGSQFKAATGTWTYVVWVTAGTAAKDIHDQVVIEDSEIAPDFPSPQTEGIHAHNLTALRNNVHHSGDGFDLEYFNHVEGNWVHDLTYFDNDDFHTNGTHNDCSQLLHLASGGPAAGHGGYNTLVGNFFSAFIAQDAGTPGDQWKIQKGVPGQGWDHQAMSDVMINSNQFNTVTDNWFEGGYSPINGLDYANAGMNLGTFERNVFDRMRYDNPGKYFNDPSQGSYDWVPRMSISVRAGVKITVGTGANANHFEAHPVTPGVPANGDILVRYE